MVCVEYIKATYALVVSFASTYRTKSGQHFMWWCKLKSQLQYHLLGSIFQTRILQLHRKRSKCTQPIYALLDTPEKSVNFRNLIFLFGEIMNKLKKVGFQQDRWVHILKNVSVEVNKT